jgi:hypothetical protein
MAAGVCMGQILVISNMGDVLVNEYRSCIPEGVTTEKKEEFPTGHAFLEMLQEAADKASKSADKAVLKESAGKSVPESLDKLGDMLSLLYRVACCYWGCNGGDHQIEWLLGRVVNQAQSAHRLMRCGFYDEALMLIRGIGETANLFWLFEKDPAQLASWKAADRKVRLNTFGPRHVRHALKAIGVPPPIDDNRYRVLCEVGTHPVPAFKPGHYSGGGPPVLGLLFQFVGYATCLNELGYAITICVPVINLLDIDIGLKNQVKDAAVALSRALGSITVLNYDEMIAKARAREQLEA